jgi:dCTP deaminase
MILTGPAIAAAVAKGDILIEPFNPIDLNPNSYNYHLFPELYKASASSHQGDIPCLAIADTGLLLEPDCLYLGCTDEIFHSTRYAMTLVGRSSVGRLGLFVNISADLGHIGSRNRWTLEIKVVQPVIVYPHQCIGQVAFWETTGLSDPYAGRYQHDERPYPSKDARLLSLPREADA